MEPLHLTDRAVLALGGPQAREFLQGLVTNDLKRLAPGKALFSALLSPQGKILFDFLVAEGDGALLIDCAANVREALVRKLRMYRLRAQVEIEVRDQLGVFAALAGHPEDRPLAYAARAISFADPRHPGLPHRSIGAMAEMPAGLPGPAAYHALRRALGVPEAGDFGSEKIFALDAGLEELNGVSFTKGCYVGQELTSRMKHRGTARKRILSVRADSAAGKALPAPGTPVIAGGQDIGEMLTADDGGGFALVRLDRLAENSGPVTVGEIAVTLIRPAWLDRSDAVSAGPA
jgi:folate-binding protein YgfZ